MASSNLDPNNIVDQIRLLTGDYIEDEPYLNDDVYLWFYSNSGNSVLDAAIEALESIINNIALSPAEWRIGDASETNTSVYALEQRLLSLKNRKSGGKVPVVFKSDRTNWNDFNKAFREDC
jgi:hypothetical protein